MTFNIRESVRSHLFDDNEELVYIWIEELIQLFEASPEGQTFLKTHGVEAVGWAESFTDMAIFREGVAIWLMTTQEIRYILYDHFPAALAIMPEKAPEIIAELKAFWQFLKREFDLENADKMLRVLNEKNIVSKLEKNLADESKYGPVKSIIMPGLRAGLDLTDEDAVAQYMQDYNERAMAEYQEIMNTPIPDKIIAKRDKIINILTPICNEHLNQEYTKLATEMAEFIATVKPESPFKRGKAASWAAGIVYALGQVNFLFDPSQDPHLTATDLCALFKVSQQTATKKARNIREGMQLVPFDPDWTLPSRIDEDNPIQLLSQLMKMAGTEGLNPDDLPALLNSAPPPPSEDKIIQFPYQNRKDKD